MICSKTRKDEVTIKQLFFHRQVKKRYRAMVSGRLEPATGIIDAPVKGKVSKTRYSVVQYTDSIRNGTITTVDLFPITGRQHQLRKHLLSVGHPILGKTPSSRTLSYTPFLTHLLTYMLTYTLMYSPTYLSRRPLVY